MADSSCSQNTKIVFNQKLSLAAGITLLVVDVGILACSIAEMVIGELTARGLGIGMAFFSCSCIGYSIWAGITGTYRAVNSLFWASIICSFFCVAFFIGQMLRIIFVIGFESVGRDVNVEDPEAAGAIWYTELAFLYVSSGCVFVLAAISGSSVVGGPKVADKGGDPEQKS